MAGRLKNMLSFCATLYLLPTPTSYLIPSLHIGLRLIVNLLVPPVTQHDAMCMYASIGLMLYTFSVDQ